ncbi:hypothetical protein SAMN05216302_103827 [Nitrosomonas aestuarii]|uniref:Uncharacterized protein n=1 Tax=Nitrosomonas aestuarii TaxID=52441 RepID=A0A1I4FJ34_9PROT|nr:hypothetical protein SAMN05216302_103827 [Nitrosomonas aestuarii]
MKKQVRYSPEVRERVVMFLHWIKHCGHGELIHHN